MKPLSAHIAESLLTGKVGKPNTHVRPQSREELEQLIKEQVTAADPKPGEEVDLNWIDISRVDDLSGLFANTTYIPVIDKWEIDHVKTFEYMFVCNEYIKSSPWPVLQKKLFASHCYGHMFSCCTSLEHAPELPATKLTISCYACMFADCVSLKNKAKTPVKDKLTGLYASGMYAGCTNIKD